MNVSDKTVVWHVLGGRTMVVFVALRHAKLARRCEELACEQGTPQRRCYATLCGKGGVAM